MAWLGWIIIGTFFLACLVALFAMHISVDGWKVALMAWGGTLGGLALVMLLFWAVNLIVTG